MSESIEVEQLSRRARNLRIRPSKHSLKGANDQRMAHNQMSDVSLARAAQEWRDERRRVYSESPREIARNAREAIHISRDHRSRVAYEILQNAEDAGATAVHIWARTDPPLLVIADNGQGLQPKDVAAVSSLFESGKTTGIGRKGVGFKASYSISDSPAIISGDEAIVFDKTQARTWLVASDFPLDYVPYQWLPFGSPRAELTARYNLPDELSRWNSMIVLPLRKGELLKTTEEEIFELDARFLLTFVSLGSLTAILADRNFELVRERVANGYRVCDSRDNSAVTWVIRRVVRAAPEDLLAEFEDDERDRFRNASLALAFSHGDDSTVVVPQTKERIFVFYPTREASPSQLFCHAEFLVTVDRTQLVPTTHDGYNEWISSALVNETVDFLNEQIPTIGSNAALRLLGVNMPRSDSRDRTRHDALRTAAAKGLLIESSRGDRKLASGLRYFDESEDDLIYEIACLTSLSHALPTRDVHSDRACKGTLRVLGSQQADAFDLLEYLQQFLESNPIPGEWSVNLWQWLARLWRSGDEDVHQAIRKLPCLPGADDWIAPEDVHKSCFLLGSLGKSLPDFVPLITAHTKFVACIQRSEHKDEILEFAEEIHCTTDRNCALLHALDAAARDWAKEPSSMSPEKLLLTLADVDISNLKRGNLLRSMPLPSTTRRGEVAWIRGDQVYVAKGTFAAHLRRTYARNPKVRWVSLGTLEELGIDLQLLEWLGCPNRPNVMSHFGEIASTREEIRVRGIMSQRGETVRAVEELDVAKSLQDLSIPDLIDRQFNSLLCVLAGHWKDYYGRLSTKSAGLLVAYARTARTFYAIPEEWWDEVLDKEVATTSNVRTKLRDCIVPTDDRAKRLRDFLPIPALRGLSEKDKAIVKGWLAATASIGLSYTNLNLATWRHIVDVAVPAYVRRHKFSQNSITRVGQAYRSYLQWASGRNIAASHFNWIVAQGATVSALVQPAENSVYLHDEPAVFAAIQARALYFDCAESHRASARRAWSLQSMRDLLNDPTIEELPDAEPAHVVFQNRWHAIKPFLLSLSIAKHGDKDHSALLTQVQSLQFRLCRRIASIVEVTTAEGKKESFTCSLRSWQKDGVTAVCFDSSASMNPLWKEIAQLTSERLVLPSSALTIFTLLSSPKEELQQAVDSDGITNDAIQLARRLLNGANESGSLNHEVPGQTADETTREDAPVKTGGADERPQCTPKLDAGTTLTAQLRTKTQETSPTSSTGNHVTSPSQRIRRITTSAIFKTASPPAHVAQRPRVPTIREKGGDTLESEILSEPERRSVEEKSRQICKTHLVSLGYKVIEMGLTSPGYDLEARRGDERLWVEVKGHLGRQWTVTLTKAEYECYLSSLGLSAGARWELWNVNNLEEDAGEIEIARFTNLPNTAVRPREYRVDLLQCVAVEPVHAHAEGTPVTGAD